MFRRFVQRLVSSGAQVRAASGPRRLHLACGDHGKTGWINVDLFGPGADLRLDLREPLPFPATRSPKSTRSTFSSTSTIRTSSIPSVGTLKRPTRRRRHCCSCASAVACSLPAEYWTLSCLTPKDSLPNMSPGARWGFRWTDGGGRSGATRRCTACTICSGRAASTSTATGEETLARVLQSAGFVDVVRRSYDPARDAANQRDRIAVHDRRETRRARFGEWADVRHPPFARPADEHAATRSLVRWN